MANILEAVQYIHAEGLKQVKTRGFTLLPLPIAPGDNGINYEGLSPFYKQIWSKIFGDSIVSQSVANILFSLFVENAPKAEEWLLTYVETKTGIAAIEINETLIATLNKIISTPQGLNDFKAATKTFFKAEAKIWIVRAFNALKSFFKGIF